MELTAGHAVVRLAPQAGGRVAQLTIAGIDYLRDPGSHGPLHWGSYPMTPYAGRIRHGRFSFGGESFELPPLLDGHAIHGVGFIRPWQVVEATADAAHLRCQLDWPLGGTSDQHFTVTEDSLTCELSVTAGECPMPVSIGWHPWFVRPERLEVAFGGMYEHDELDLPTGRIVPMPDGPWDNCFVLPEHMPRLRYRHLTITVESACTHWVVYTMPPDAWCVEPCSAPPNSVNMGSPDVLHPGETMSRAMTLRW